MVGKEEFDLERELQQLNLSSERPRISAPESTAGGMKPLKPEEIGRVAISE